MAGSCQEHPGAGILEGSGLNPLPRRTPLESVIHSRKEMDGYSVEKRIL